jgi:hypothetical protein
MLLAVGFGMSAVAMWLLWRRSSDRVRDIRVATAIPLVAWGAYYVPLFVPGAEIEDVPGEENRLAGIPLNLVLAGVLIVLTLVGYHMSTRRAEA